jgi:hypothetical protein
VGELVRRLYRRRAGRQGIAFITRGRDVIGGFTPGIVPLVLGRIHELLPHSAEQERAAWGHATTRFALFQAAAAYGFSWLFARNNGDYLLLFELGGVAVTLALAIDLVMALTVARKPPETRDDTGLRNH